MRIAIMAAALLVAAVGISATAVFLCVALYNALMIVLSAPLAALSAALIVFVLSILVILLGKTMFNQFARRAKHARAKRGGTANAFSAEFGRMMGEKAQTFVNEKPLLSLIVALIGGFAVGANPRLRAFLETILKI
jgi:hypothetical protein